MKERTIPGGLFLAVEGPEGAGKTVQSRRLSEWLTSLGFNVVLTREPGGTAMGEQIRHLLLDLNLPQVSQETELLLFLAARAQLVREVIRPALEAGRVIISDRFSASTLAYQGYGLGANLSLIRVMDEFATGNLAPALTLILDIDPEMGLERRRADQLLFDRIEGRDKEFHRRVRQGYIEAAKEEPDRFRVIDASSSAEKVWEAVRAEVAALLAIRLPEPGAELNLLPQHRK
jgi:dTMP kinase